MRNADGTARPKVYSVRGVRRKPSSRRNASRRLSGRAEPRRLRPVSRFRPEGSFAAAAAALPVTYGYLALCVLAYVGTLLLDGVSSRGGFAALGPTHVALDAAGALDTDLVFGAGQWERCAAAGVLHLGLLHLLFNCGAIRQMGSLLEAVVGARGALFAYGCAQLGTAAAPLVFAAATGETNSSAGASGVACGLGATLWALWRGAPAGPLAHYRREIGAWLVVGLLMGLIPGISFLGHLGGTLGGAAAGTLFRVAAGASPAARRTARAVSRAAVLLSALFLTGIGVAAAKAPGRIAFDRAFPQLREAALTLGGWIFDEDVGGRAREPLDAETAAAFQRALGGVDAPAALRPAEERLRAAFGRLGPPYGAVPQDDREAAAADYAAAVAALNDAARARHGARIAGGRR
jgi:membrane associated rhomboid family serine protease